MNLHGIILITDYHFFCLLKKLILVYFPVRVGGGDDEFEILDVSNNGRNWVQKMFSDLSKQSMAKQLAVGGVSGWCVSPLSLT